jgi:hypothetical protein
VCLVLFVGCVVFFSSIMLHTILILVT